MVIGRLSERELRVSSDSAAAPPRAQNIRPESGYVLAADREHLLGQRAVTVWLTGLPGAGKSSTAHELERRLMERGHHVYVLDGDNLRFGLNRDLGFSAPERKENVRRIAEVARLFNDAGTIAIAALIAPFRADRDDARTIIGADRFCEVYVATPLEVCELRDPKGLYRKARAGQIVNFTGISSPYEAPQSPFLVLDATEHSREECAGRLLDRLGPLIRRSPTTSTRLTERS